MVRQGTTSTSSRSCKVPSHRDLVKTVSKQLKYYFEVKRQEDGFDLSGPECPRPDYPALKSRPMLLYEGLHDRSVKHFYSDHDVKQKITHMHTGNASTADAKRTEKLMKKTMDKVSYVPPWMGVGMNGGNAKYTKNSEKYVSGTLGEWSMKPKKSRRRGYGNPEPTLKKVFSEPPQAKPRMRRSCPSGWIDNRECRRLVTGASRILTSSEFREALSRPHSSKSASQRSSVLSGSRARSASPEPTKSSSVTSYTAVKQSSRPRLTHRPQSSSNSLHRTTSYHDAKDVVVREHEREKTSQNLKKGRIYYDIDGRRKPVAHKVKNDEGYLEREDERSPRSLDDDDWLRNEVRRQDVEEKRMPYNNSVRPVELSHPDTARSEDVSKREGVRKRPRSAKRSKSRSSRGEKDRDSHVTLSDGSYEEVKLDDSDSGEEAYYEDRGCQTGWELFVQYDQSENILYDGETETARYKVIVRTGSSVGASTKASIYLILYGNRGRSPDIPLTKSENHKILFQQNASDVFYVTCSYVGTLNKIAIGHDSDSEAWFLDSVTVEDPIKREAFEFICNEWLSVKSADKKTRRHLEITASRNVESDAGEEDADEKEEEEKEKVESRSPKTSVVSKSGSVSSLVSTSHLRNDTETVDTTDSKAKGSISLPSETDSTTTQGTHAKRVVRLQEPFVAVPSRERRGRITPDNLDDFESDVTLHGDKNTLSSRRSESTVSDSEERTARFEERSVLSQSTVDQNRRQEVDRLEAFKAGQKAERERQKLEEEKQKQVEVTHQSEFLRGPTIHQAAKTGNLARVKELIDHNDELKNSVDPQGNTPLHLATIQGHKETVQFLAATGADLDSRDQIGYEPVHMAALHGHVNCLMILVAMGASIHSQTDDCKRPLHLSAMSGNMETCKWLVANRSRLDEEDDFGRTPVDMAENNGHADVAHFLRTCINELKDRRSSLESLLIGKDEWKDDKPERPITYHDDDSDTEPGGSVADLRRAARLKEEKAAKQKAYEEMQQQLATSDMTYLDRIRYEVDHS